MLRLVGFELEKMWGRRSFLLSVCVLVMAHVFLLWYTSLPKGETPPLSAYRKIQEELSGKGEAQKAAYVEELKETLDGISFVREVLAMQGFQNEMGKALAEQEMQSHPGVFEKYYGQYESGGYLKFTDSLEQEKALVDEVYEEQRKVHGYGEYLQSIQDQNDILDGISIFGGQDGTSERSGASERSEVPGQGGAPEGSEMPGRSGARAQTGFAARNREKSAADYAGLTDENICFVPSKGVVSAMGAAWQDLFLFFSVMLFVGGLVTEEKEKKLFFVTRGTRRGILPSIAAKLAALLVHCVLLTSLLYSMSLVFYGQGTGWFSPFSSLQSLAPYQESTLSISILAYIFCSVLTKALFLFGTGSLLVAFCILSNVAVVPFLVGAGIAGIGALSYVLIPAGSSLSVLKYLNPVGLMKTENWYGGYLNFDLFGYPASRLTLSLAGIGCGVVGGVLASVWLFARMQGLEMKRLRLPFSLPFRPHVGILRHEAYKIFIMKRALVILLAFMALLAFRCFDFVYAPSVEERYYQDVMVRLEGGLTEEKEEFVLAEKERYDEALAEMERIEQLVNAGELTEPAADALGAGANMTLAFYPAFQKVEAQYEKVKESGGCFVYETGYLYAFGVLRNTFAEDFLLLSVGIILLAGGAFPMEYQTGTLGLLCATRAGRRKVFGWKIFICVMMAATLALVPIVCRALHVSSAYPMHEPGARIQNIACYSGFAVSMPIGAFVALFALSQIAAAVLVALVVLALSAWRKNQAQAVFFALLVLCVPLILKLLGLEAAGWCSLYPLYAWTGGA